MTKYTEDMFKNEITIKLANKAGNIFDEFKIRSGSNLWVFIRKRGHPIGSACSGVGVCAACHVRILNEENVKVSDQSAFEKTSLKNNKHDENSRLSCLTRVFSDLTVQADYW